MKRVDFTLRCGIVFLEKYYIYFVMSRINQHKRLTFHRLRETTQFVILRDKDREDNNSLTNGMIVGRVLLDPLYHRDQEKFMEVVVMALERDLKNGFYINKKETILEFLSAVHNKKATQEASNLYI